MEFSNKQKEAIAELQKSVDEMRELPQYRQYVNQAKLGLLDSRFEIMDKLLAAGILH